MVICLASSARINENCAHFPFYRRNHRVLSFIQPWKRSCGLQHVIFLQPRYLKWYSRWHRCLVLQYFVLCKKRWNIYFKNNFETLDIARKNKTVAQNDSNQTKKKKSLHDSILDCLDHMKQLISISKPVFHFARFKFYWGRNKKQKRFCASRIWFFELWR